MITDFASRFSPEPSVLFTSSGQRFMIWVGYFDEIYQATMTKKGFEKLPPLFRSYHLIEGWADDEEEVLSQAEYVIDTMCELSLSDFFSTYKNDTLNCLEHFIQFLKMFKDEENIVLLD